MTPDSVSVHRRDSQNLASSHPHSFDLSQRQDTKQNQKRERARHVGRSPEGTGFQNLLPVATLTSLVLSTGEDY